MENIREYVSNLLSDLEDDLFENAGVDYDDIDFVMETVLEIALQEVKKMKGGN